MEWTSKSGYATQVANLLNGTGSTGIQLKPGATVFNDSSPDTLKGGQDKDWFLVDPRGDTIKGTDVDEIFTDLDLGLL